MRATLKSGSGHDRYGVVIDAGSSGSRVYVYKWQDPQFSAQQSNSEIKKSVPEIHLNKEWTFKTSPGLSSFAKKPEKAFRKHIEPLLEFAEDVIPQENLRFTPVFIQATAGMRLLPEKKRNAILDHLCHDIKQSTDFLVGDCRSQIQVIDGETEGLYGWIGLNYLLGNFNNFNVSDARHSSSGFMDMGGASAQIAFVPSSQEEIVKHDDDISTVTLRSINGDTQNWRVFVSTWLGFGANQARKRYLVQMLNSLTENSNDRADDDYNTRVLNDPCMLKGSYSKFEFNDVDFQVSGSGNYEHCSKSIFPLLMKDLPCREEPCLFNGIHAPAIDFYNDKFVGTSEFWYTANDVFKVGGEYNFHEFSRKVKEFCETDWAEVEKLRDSGKYDGISVELLSDSCFKANWILSVLHEGFDMPRVGIELPDSAEDQKDKTEDVVAAVAAFRSTDSVNGHDLSWTLGKIVLYVSASVASSKSDGPVGIMPSDNDVTSFKKVFISGSLAGLNSQQDPYRIRSWSFLRFLVLLVSLVTLVFVLGKKFPKKKISALSIIDAMVSQFKTKLSRWRYSSLSEDPLSTLEEGYFVRPVRRSEDREGIQVRSRSMFNLEEARNSHKGHTIKNSSQTSINGETGLERNKLRTAFSLADFSKFIKPGASGKKSQHSTI
ncbi:LANO_0H19570g1_1 [Lachancea nothofagi CBS 11611]|uniref:LANO_0H19570g1_1 n=1 Tax=Lachancea nothofagi CBS 11611 TaxID=1266666 RepID=A0A1G4KN93_9SACH|nr:LANO_0H19570g1_1 [Lachancea nothofagi CBS 11611]